MPVIARFNGITIRMYLRQKEHNPPHIHATYSEHLGLFALDDGDMLKGIFLLENNEWSEILLYIIETD